MTRRLFMLIAVATVSGMLAYMTPHLDRPIRENGTS
jgi:hypothetical protein